MFHRLGKKIVEGPALRTQRARDVFLTCVLGTIALGAIVIGRWSIQLLRQTAFVRLDVEDSGAGEVTW